jgi:hypothetical protein
VLSAADSKLASVACVCVTALNVWNSCRDQLFHKWNSTEALVFRVEQWNSAVLFLHQLCGQSVIDVQNDRLLLASYEYVSECEMCVADG